MRNPILALTAVAVLGSAATVEARALTHRVDAPASAALFAAQPLAQSKDGGQTERGGRHSRTAAQEREICKEIRLVDRGNPGKGDAVYESVTIECPADPSTNIEAQQATLCGQTILVKRGYPGQGEEVLEGVKVRCPSDKPRAEKGRNLCETQTLLKRGYPGKGEDVFRTVLVDCPRER